MYQTGIRFVIMWGAFWALANASQVTGNEFSANELATPVAVRVHNMPVMVTLPLQPSKLKITAPAETTWPLPRDLTALILLETGDIRWISRFQQASRGYWYAAQDAWPLILNTETRALQSLIDQTTYPEIKGKNSLLLDCFFRNPQLAKSFYQNFGALSAALERGVLHNFFQKDYALAQNYLLFYWGGKRMHPQILDVEGVEGPRGLKSNQYHYIYNYANRKGAFQISLNNLRLQVIPTAFFIPLSGEGFWVSMDGTEETLIKVGMPHCHLRWISPEIKSWQRLEILELNNNDLTTLPDEISCLKNLKELNLSHNQFKVIPRGVVALLPTLKKLDLGGNPLGIFPADLVEQLAKLEEFKFI